MAADPDHDHADHDHPRPAVSDSDPRERIELLEVDYTIRRDGRVGFEQRFRVHAGGVAIKRGPVLNYLTAHIGPVNLVLDSDLKIESVERDGAPEDFKLERGSGFSTLFVGSQDRLLEHRSHTYRIRGEMDGNWIPGEGELSTVFDVVDALPKLPIDAILVTVRFPEGVRLTRYTPAVDGASTEAKRWGPPCEAAFDGEALRIRTTAALGVERNFFVNLTWPSATFAETSPWLKVMRQHPRLPLAVFSALLLLWALGILLSRLVRRPIEGSYAVTTR